MLMLAIDVKSFLGKHILLLTYLVSSQFNEAAELSSTVLRKLVVTWESVEHSMHTGIDDNNMEGIMEAAGMVLVQAYHESGRTGLIFKDLETIFGCTAKVPSSVLLAGVSLQISARLYLKAQLFLESFLKHWACTRASQQFCTLNPGGHNHKCFRLNSERYNKIVDIYCVQVLAKGLGRLDLALQWVEEADVPSERKQDMHEKLDKFESSRGRKEETETSLVCYPDKVTSTIPESGEYISGSQVSEGVEAKSGTGFSKQAIKTFDSHSSSLKSIFLFSPFMDVMSRWMTHSSIVYSNYNSRWKILPTIVSENKLSFGGAAAVFLTIAIYRQRLRLSRLFGGFGRTLQLVLRAIFTSLYDFWQLAFNVQLNPLAAVQPLPPTQYGSYCVVSQEAGVESCSHDVEM
ncbi:hypothetical protein GOP47_0018874 [Adiantum capillus-veneris]|uniref:Uncharacterized protein n=1 Tax=Adiantum capillus-veneris TaxID=13818 RepID=A0A9D4ZA21_ADICA|nr:hypothetical protein GOP47_0018874 [Adiantum capillus-veneris]